MQDVGRGAAEMSNTFSEADISKYNAEISMRPRASVASEVSPYPDGIRDAATVLCPSDSSTLHVSTPNTFPPKQQQISLSKPTRSVYPV